MEIKTLELTGIALDYAVAVCEGISPIIDDGRMYSRYPQGKEWDYPITYQNWSQAGPIIEREVIVTTKEQEMAGTDFYSVLDGCGAFGKTYLQAAMRCYVASKLGDIVEIPDELVSN